MDTKKFGVIIGVSDYTKVAPHLDLRFTINDAERLYSILRNKAGFEQGRLHLLCDRPGNDLRNVSKEPSRSNILSLLDEVAQQATEEDLIMLYFAGHGAELADCPYLFTNDTRMNVIADTAVDVSQLNKLLQQSKARCVLRVFDACRFSFGEARWISQPMSRGFASALLTDAKGWSTFCSCSTGQLAYEHPDLSQGVFSHYVCEGLSGAAANEDGSVTWERLVDYVKMSVGNFCKSHSFIQTPHSISDLSGALVLVTVPVPEKPTQPPPDSTLNQIQAQFSSALDKQFASLPDHVRDFHLSSAEELKSIEQMLDETSLLVFGSLAHPKVTVEIEKKAHLDRIDGGSWITMLDTMNKEGVRKEFTEQTTTLEVRFVSSEPVIPTSILRLTLVRFHFFYWLWCRHHCIKNAAHTDWNPAPPFAQRHFTLKPAAALSPQKVQRLLVDNAQLAIEMFSNWCNQSREHFASRVEPLQKAATLIS
jgi:hypothetical protein